MELKDVLEKRTSVRQFTGEEIPYDNLREMIRRASLAPSINNAQPWKFYVITNKSVLQHMASAIKEKLDAFFPELENEKQKSIKETVIKFSTFFTNAPALIAVASKPYEAVVDKILDNSDLSHTDFDSLRNYPNIQSIGASVQNILLSAVDMGYDACWLSGPLVAKSELEKILHVEEPYSLSTFVVVGKREGEIKRKDKKSVEEVFIHIG